MRVFEFDEMCNMMHNYLKEDIQLYSVGHTTLDEHYKFMLGNVTDITGYPYMGKTLVLNEILFNLSTKHGTRHLLHMPDSGKPEEVMAILIQKYTGKTFDKRYEHNLICESEIEQAVYWVHNYFKVYDYPRDKNGLPIRPTPKEYWEYACSLDIHTATIDSWNYMKHEGSGTDYLAEILSYRNELAQIHKKHFFTIIHPKNPTGLNYGEDGKLKPADQYSLMGGSEWNNNGKNIISIHKESKESPAYQIWLQKTKPRIVGKTGMVELEYDLRYQKYFTADQGKRIFAFGEAEDFTQWDAAGGMENFKQDDEPPF